MFSSPAGATRRPASTAAAGLGNRAKSQPNPFSPEGAGDEPSKRDKRARRDDGNQASKALGQDAAKAKRGRPEKRGPGVGLASNKQATRRDARRKSSPAQRPNEPTGQSFSTEASPGLLDPDVNPGDPYAQRIYRQLHADGISPPPWPPNPGSLGSKSAMSRFREQHEEYRQRVRRSLTKAGLIDDPNRRKRLSEAISFKGICEEMCPEYEMIQRITESDVVKAEKHDGVADLKRMVKKLARSAAGQEAPLPMDVRSTRALATSLNYMFSTLLNEDENLRQLHGFIWDRTRAIRRDFAFFSSMNEVEIKTHVYVLESIARFHITALHLLPKFVGPGDRVEDVFSQHQELEQLGKTLLSLRDIYDDCRAQDIVCENEAEFRAYYLLFHGRDPGIIETLQLQWDQRFWDESGEVKTALTLVEALHNDQDFVGSGKHKESGPLLACASAYTVYFDIVEKDSTSYTMACFAECHFMHVRRSVLQAVKRALGRPKKPVEDVTAEALNEFLRYDTVAQAVEFAELHGLAFAPNAEDPGNINKYGLKLTDRRPIPYTKLNHQFSQRMVEKKRGKVPLPEVLRRAVYPRVRPSEYMPNGSREESLFVQDESRSKAPAPPKQCGFIIEPDPDLDAGESQGAAAWPKDMPPLTSALPTRLAVGASSSFGASNPFGTVIKLSSTQGSGEGGGNAAKARPNPFAPSDAGASDKGDSGEKPNPFSPFGTAGNDNSQAKPNPFASLPGGFGSKTEGAAAARPNPFAGITQPGGGAAAQKNPFGGPSPADASSFGPGPRPGDANGPAKDGVVSNGGAQAKPNPFASAWGAGGDSSTPLAAKPFASAAPGGAAPSFLGPGTASSTAPAATPPSLGAMTNGQPAVPSATTPSILGGMTSTASLTTSAAAMASMPGGSTSSFAPPAAMASMAGGNTHTAPWATATNGASAAPAPTAPMVLPAAAPLAHAAASYGTAVGSAPQTLASSAPGTAAPGEQGALPGGAAPMPPLGGQHGGQATIGMPTGGIPDATGQSTPDAASDLTGQVGVRSTTTQSPRGGSTTSASSPGDKRPITEPEPEGSGPTGPTRDLLGNFNEWFVKGDNGLMSDFLVETVRLITEDAFRQHAREVEEQRLREEEERINAEVERFRTYNLLLKYFYRWKRNAREKHLRQLRRQGRDEMRAFYAARHDASRRAREEAAEAQRKQVEVPSAREAAAARSREFADLVKSRREAKQEAAGSLVASRILSGQGRERELAQSMAGSDFGSSAGSQASRGPSMSSSTGLPRKEESKTQALRRKFFGQPDFGQPERFRRSLPSMSSEERDSGGTKKRSSNASSRWKLKAMGIVPLEDGTAVPESLAREMAASSMPRYPRSVSPWRRRRQSATAAIEAETARLTPPTPRTDPAAAAVEPPMNKRKWWPDEEEATESGSTTEGGATKRVMSDAEKVRMELQALRTELEEGTEWFRQQNQRLGSESEARGAPRFDESI